MVRRLTGFLVIFLAIGHATAYYLISLLNLYNTIAWSETIVNEQILSYNNSIISGNNSLPILDKFFTELDQFSNDNGIFFTGINKRNVKMFDMDINKGNNFYKFPWRPKLWNLFETVIRHYNKARSRNFKIVDESKNESLDSYFIRFVLEDSLSLPSALENIYNLIIPSAHRQYHGLMENAASNVNEAHNCDKFVSTQQLMLIFYHKLAIIEMKGLTALTYVYSLLQPGDKDRNYPKAITIAKEKFQQRMRSYHKTIKNIMSLLPRQIHRCNINIPERGVNFIEFVHYHHAMLISSSILGTRQPGMAFYLCSTKCEDINHDYLDSEFGVKIYNVQTIDSRDLQICEAGNGSTRDFLWWINRERLYGHNETCSHKIISGNDIHWEISSPCNICQCSVIQSKPRHDNDILRLSVSPQTSDIHNNMIVVGVKFVNYDKAIHLQIQQSKFSPDHTADNYTVWKKLDDDHSSINTKLHYETLANFSGQVLLDDVILPPKYAVTGVQFQTSDTPVPGFYLLVQGTEFDLATGKLDPDSSVWFLADNWDISANSDYERIEIEMNDPDDPIRCRGYNYDGGKNKFIKLKHSSIVKDAGQSTVPYIDAQSVQTFPPFPLSGIGLFYRGKVGCGGYIAPRIFTLDITQYN